MRRVTWPNRKQVEGTTAVVIVSVFAFAAYFASGGYDIWRTVSTRLFDCFLEVDGIWKTEENVPFDQQPDAESAEPAEDLAPRTKMPRRPRRMTSRPLPSRASGGRLPMPVALRRSGTSSTPIPALKTRWRNRCKTALGGLRVRRQDRPDSDPHRRSGGAAQRQEGHQQAPGLSGLRAGGNGNERRAVACGKEHAAGHRLRGRRQRARAAERRRSELRFCTARHPRRSGRVPR